MFSQLTTGQLRSAAGFAFTRGEEYWREGRVASCVVDGTAIDGVVTGTQPYRVRVAAYDGNLVASCTCPVGRGLCKHAVALVLCYLGQTGRVDAPVRLDGIVDAFANRDELEAWATEHHVRHTLFVSAETLCAELTIPPQDYWIKNVLGRMAIREIGALDLAARVARSRGVDVALAKAAYRVLQRAAASVRDGIAEEQQRPESAPDPQLGTLWNRLVALRRTIRAEAFPRSRVARETATWAFDPRAASITWKERGRVARPRDYGTHTLATRLSIAGGGEAQLECTCGARDATCTHGLALIDATLDLLEDPARGDAARSLAGKLLQPGWSRALDELDAIESRATPKQGIELWWRIDAEPDACCLTPILKKQTKKGMSAGARIDPMKLLDDHRHQLTDRDIRVAEHLAAWLPGAQSTYPVHAFRALVGHPRLIAGDPAEAMQLASAPLGFTALPAGEHIRLEPTLEGARMNPKLLASLLAIFAPGEPLLVLDPDRDRCVIVEIGEDARRLWAVLAKHGDTFPPESHSVLLERLGAMEARMPLEIPHALKGRELAAKPTVVVRLRLLPDATLELELFVRAAPGTPLFPPSAGPRDVMTVKNGERGYVRRDLGSELAWARGLLEQLSLAGAEEGPPNCFQVADPEQALRIVGEIQTPPAGLEAEWIDEKPVIRRSGGPEKLRVRVERERDWFGIQGELKIESGRIELAVLLDAMRRQQRFVRIDANRWIELSEALRARLEAVADQTYVARDRLELSPGAVPAIRELQAAGARVELATAWSELAAKLASAKKLRPRPPATLRATLRDYQIAGHAWLSRLAGWGAGACLADDMGLGKTVQAIAVLLDRAKLGPALVLAPTSVTYNWVDELARFAPSLRPVVYTEQADRAGALAGLGKQDVVIASYGLLVNDAEKLAATKFATLVVDEAQALKNPTTRRARAARTLDADFRIALSGTPMENHLGELWSLFAIVFPGLLGSWDQFRDRYAIPIERHKDPNARAALARVLSPFLLRRTKQEVARELPPRTEIEVPVALSDDEHAMYEDARLAAIADLASGKQAGADPQRRIQVLAALTRLRLLACNPKLHDATSTVPSSKLKRAVELLEELRSEGHRALVFSQFTSHLALVRAALATAGFSTLYLDGSTAVGERRRLVEAFQGGQGDAFLISLKAGGQGINLTAADYILHLDPWWNPAVEDQATDRAHRIGQTKPVTVYRLIARGTIEERIVALHKDKRALVAGILAGTDAATRLTTQDLMALLQQR